MKNKNRKIALFMDNLSVHRSRKVTEYMDRLGFKYIFNAPYCPQFNPIEMVFSMMKAKYKKIRADDLINNLKTNVSMMV